jgi:V-type H+-transporting ATPase subunit H
MTARLISDANLQLLRRYDKRPPELQASLLDESGPAYVDAFLTVLRNVTKEETVQYILALLVQMLQENPRRALLFHQLPPSTDPYAILLRLLQRSDWFTQDKACRLLVSVIQHRPEKGSFSHMASSSAAASSSSSSGPADPAEQAITSLVDWLCGQLRRYPVSGGAATRVPQQVQSAVHALAVLLREKPVRAIFTTSGGVGLLAPLLSGCTGPTHSQLTYEICLCVWQLSFHPAAVTAMSTTGAPPGARGGGGLPDTTGLITFSCKQQGCMVIGSKL